MSENHGKLSSGPTSAPSPNEDSERDPGDSETFEVPDLAGSGTLDRLIDTAKDYARQSTAENTNAAYKADWAHFSSWCRGEGDWGNIRSNAQQPTIKISGDVPAAIYALKAEDGLLLQVFATPQKIDKLGSDRPSERFVG